MCPLLSSSPNDTKRHLVLITFHPQRRTDSIYLIELTWNCFVGDNDDEIFLFLFISCHSNVCVDCRKCMERTHLDKN